MKQFQQEKNWIRLADVADKPRKPSQFFLAGVLLHRLTIFKQKMSPLSSCGFLNRQVFVFKVLFSIFPGYTTLYIAF